MGVSDVFNFDIAVSEVFMAHHLFELVIWRMSDHRLSFASPFSILHLLLGVSLKILSHCFQHDDSILTITKVDVGHAITKACVAFERDLLSLRSCDYPVARGTVGNRVAILFQLWD